MTDENNIPTSGEDDATNLPPEDMQPNSATTPEQTAPENPEPDRMNERLERLGGEPAPVITPEEFARLQKAGQVHIDARGRVRTERPRGVDPGVSLRKRRAWYHR